MYRVAGLRSCHVGGSGEGGVCSVSVPLVPPLIAEQNVNLTMLGQKSAIFLA